MADAKVIAASLTVDSDQAIKNMLKLKDTVADLKRELANTKAGSEEQVAAFKKLKTAEEDLAKANKQLADSNKDQAGHFGKLKEGINQLPGATGAAGKGVAGLNTQFKALLANPIGLILTAIVLALTALYKAFTNTFAGAQKVEQVFAGLKAAAQALFDNLSNLGSALIKFMKFDFSGAVDQIKGVAKAAADAYTETAKLTKELQEIKMRDLEGDVDDAKRKARLSALKEELQSEELSFKRKREIALELKKDAEYEQTEGIKDDRRRAEIQIRLLTMQKDGAKKNAEEISALQVELINTENERSQEVIRINKQLRQIDKQEAAKLKEERQKAIEEEKARRQQLVEFTNKLTKLQQDNELALTKDSYQKELKALENRIADEKRMNELAFKDKKLTADQLNQLNAALDIQANIQRDGINEKHNKEVATKEAAFQKELADISTKIRLSGITDARQLELTQLEIGYNEKLAQAITRYADDAAKLAQVQAAIDEQYRAEKAAKEAKFKEEDDKKQLEKDLAAQEKIFNDQAAAIEARQPAVDQEQLLIQRAFDNKVISEEDYNSRIEALAEKRKKILELETAHRKAQAEEAAGVLEKLSELIGKKTAAGKLLGIAAATINTFQGASEALKQPSTLPSPFDVIAKIANVAAVIATGIKTVKAINEVQVPGGGSGSVSAPSLTTPAAPVAPTQTSTSLDQGTINNIGNAAAGGVNSVRAYVVEQDSQAAAQRAQRLAGAAVLGG